ncbi:l-aspartate oxidase [Brachyspira sp. CAG:484]|nr:l-aspartate oxidase [Brachyspira sp. CAG:484]
MYFDRVTRKYKAHIMKYSRYSTVIVGSGIAGLYAALKIEQQTKLPDGILILTKSKLGESNSRYAQGGMVAVLKENKADSTESHISDTIKAGAGLSEFNTVKFISENSDKVIKDLLKFGVEFDRDENNQLCFTREAAHSVRRILHSGGDATGKMIEQALCKKVVENSNIEVYEQTIAVELLVNGNSECKGILVYNDVTGEYETIYASAIILATGGIGQLYKYTTNPVGATGDGLALAYNAGAVMQDMEFVQFHPTALAIDGDENRFLISEAVRGEGAKLVDGDGVEFMHKYDERKELAPRDIVTRANFNEMTENHVDCVYLNAACIDKDKLARRFPNISKKCAENGIDIAHDFIPVAPAAHYFMGGVKTDVEGRTSVKGLYAIGEVSSTGLHGGNRLASNSLLECVVCAYEVADYLKQAVLIAPKQIDMEIKSLIDMYSEDIDAEELDIPELKKELQSIMWDYVGILRSEKSLMNALEKIEALKEHFPRIKKCLSKQEYEFKNMLTVAKLIVISALRRKESRGAHYRLDYLNTNEECVHNCLTKREGELSFVK